jgi:hypothetical protein
MSFADPQSVTLNSASVSLPRTASGNGTGVFTSSDSLARLSVAHAYGKRIRRTARLDVKKLTADPYNDGLNSIFSMATYLVVDVPLVGYTIADQLDVVKGLTTWLTASTNAKTTQLLGGEN